MSKRITHLSVSIEGVLRNYKNRNINLFYNDDGTRMSSKDARAELKRLQALGHKLIGPNNCEGFDPFGGGCPGHDVEEETKP